MLRLILAKRPRSDDFLNHQWSISNEHFAVTTAKKGQFKHLNSQYSKIPMAASVIGIPRPGLSVFSVRCSEMWCLYLFGVFIFVLINDSKSRKQAFRGGAKDHWPHTVFEEDEKSTSDSSSASSSSPKPAWLEVENDVSAFVFRPD